MNWSSSSGSGGDRCRSEARAGTADRPRTTRPQRAKRWCRVLCRSRRVLDSSGAIRSGQADAPTPVNVTESGPAYDDDPRVSAPAPRRQRPGPPPRPTRSPTAASPPPGCSTSCTTPTTSARRQPCAPRSSSSTWAWPAPSRTATASAASPRTTSSRPPTSAWSRPSTASTPSHERDFLSYAVPTVTGEVKRYFRDFGWAVRPPRRVQELQGSIAKLSSELTQKLGRSPRPSEVAAAARHRRRVGHRGARRRRRVHAGLARRTGRGGRRRHPRRPDARRGRWSSPAPRPGSCSARPCASSPPRDRRILELRFFEGWTQEQIAQDIGVTQMQVSRLLSRILKDLRAELT